MLVLLSKNELRILVALKKYRPTFLGRIDFSENVYFRKETIEKNLGAGVMDLRNIFKVGEIVQFDAVMGPDDARCKWR